MAIIWKSSHCHATLLLSGDGFIQAVWLFFWIPSHILYAIYIYMFNLYSPFVFQMTGRSSL